MYNILSESIFEGKEKAATLAGYTDIGEVINDIFSCDGLLQCCNKTGVYIKKGDLVYARKQPKNSFVSFEKIIKDIYNCCGEINPNLCRSMNKSTYWINGGVLRPVATIETISLNKLIKKVFTCCGIENCSCTATAQSNSTSSFSAGAITKIVVKNEDGVEVLSNTASYTFANTTDVASALSTLTGLTITVSAGNLTYTAKQKYSFLFYSGASLLYTI